MASLSVQLQHGSDARLINFLRADQELSVVELSDALGVTATAVRQRLARLIRAGVVEKVSASAVEGRSRGRPAHAYRLTDRGRQIGGDNFRDLAMVLWRELREVRHTEVRRGLFNRIGVALAGLYRESVTGQTPTERLARVATVLGDREIPCRTGVSAGLPVLTSHACPYPELAEQDRGICSAERVMIEELVGAPVRLSECRLDGDACCRFTVQAVPVTEGGRPAMGLASRRHSESNSR